MVSLKLKSFPFTEVTCDRVSGDPGEIKEAVAAWTVPGADGIGAQKLGKNDSGFQLMVVKYDSQANVLAWVTQIENMQGSIVTVTNDRGTVTNDVLLETVGNARIRNARNAANPATGTRAGIIIQGKRTK